MITSKDEYLRRLHDIQNKENLKELVALPSDEPRFVIDANTRNIFIPDEFTFLAVKNDHAAETVYFEIDRYFDQSDLSTQTCIIQYEVLSTSGFKSSEGFYVVPKLDVDTIPGKIIFGWEIQNDVTFLAGDVRFSVRFYSTEEIGDSIRFAYNFNTTFVSLPVKDTLNTTDKSVSIVPGVIETLTEKFRKSVDVETKRAKAAEKANADNLAVESKRAADEEQRLNAAISTENTRAEKAEQELLAILRLLAAGNDTAITACNRLAALWGITLPEMPDQPTDTALAVLGQAILGKMILGRNK